MMFNCKQVTEQLLAFRDGTLSEEDTEILRKHLHLCPPCGHLLGGYEETLRVLKRLQPVPMPEGLMERLQRRLDDNC